MVYPNADYFAYIFFLTIFLYIPFLILFYSLRHIYPISARTPPYMLVLAIDIFFLALDIFLTGLFYDVYPCWAFNFLGFFPYTTAVTLYNYRTLHVLFSYEISSHLRNYQAKRNSGSRESWKEDWYTKHRWLVQPKTINRFLFIQNLIYIIIYLIYCIGDPNIRGLKPCDHDSFNATLWSAWNYGNTATLIVITGIIAWLLRKHKGDAFALKLEIKITFYLFFGAFASFFLLLGLGLPTKVAGFGGNVACHSLLLMGIVFPYFLSRKERQKLEARQQELLQRSGRSLVSTSDRMSLIEFLTRRDGFQIFLNYLETEFSSENLLFWEEVNQVKIRRDESRESLFSTLWRIYAKFCVDNAPLQVNLPYSIRETLKVEFNSQSFTTKSFEDLYHIFDEAQTNIYDLMNNDSFPRFQLTRERTRVQSSGPIELSKSLGSPNTPRESIHPPLSRNDSDPRESKSGNNNNNTSPPRSPSRIYSPEDRSPPVSPSSMVAEGSRFGNDPLSPEGGMEQDGFNSASEVFVV